MRGPPGQGPAGREAAVPWSPPHTVYLPSGWNRTCAQRAGLGAGPAPTLEDVWTRPRLPPCPGELRAGCGAVSTSVHRSHLHKTPGERLCGARGPAEDVNQPWVPEGPCVNGSWSRDGSGGGPCSGSCLCAGRGQAKTGGWVQSPGGPHLVPREPHPWGWGRCAGDHSRREPRIPPGRDAELTACRSR